MAAQRRQESRPRGRSGHVGCERRQMAAAAESGAVAASVGNRGRSPEEERAEAFFPSARATTNAADPKRAMREQQAQKELREQQAQKNSVGPSKYELQGPTV